nr:hypothetical protein [Citrobacter freundii]
MFYAAFSVKPDGIHLAAWLCSQVKFTACVSGGFGGGLLPILPGSRRKRAQPRFSGAGNGCYGKFVRLLH